MNELEGIIAGFSAARSRGVDCVLATVFAVHGSTYRRPGARMLLTLDGQSVGAISGGCLEGELRKKAAWLTRDAGAAVVRFDTTSDDEVVWEFGLGCRGVVYVLLERLPADRPDAALDLAAAVLRDRRDALIATVVETSDADLPIGSRWLFDAMGEPIAPRSGNTLRPLPDGLAAEVRAAATERNSRLATLQGASGPLRVFMESLRPPIHLLVCGSGHDVVPVVAAASALGWRVTVADSRARGPATRFAPAEVVACKPLDWRADSRIVIDDRTAAVVMSHNFFDDRAALGELLRSPAGYIGLLGPASRSHELLESLADDGIRPGPSDAARLHAPIGLDVGAETPAEIAAAIVGEIHASFAGFAGGMLRDRRGPIHAREKLAPPPIEPTARAGRQCPI